MSGTGRTEKCTGSTAMNFENCQECEKFRNENKSVDPMNSVQITEYNRHPRKVGEYSG